MDKPPRKNEIKDAEKLPNPREDTSLSDVLYFINNCSLDDFLTLTIEHQSAKKKRISQVESVFKDLKNEKIPRGATPPVYKNKKDGRTWSGIGRKPLWVTDHLEKGGKLEELKIV